MFFNRLDLFQIFFIGLAIRLLCAFIIGARSNYDIDSYYLVSNHVLAGEDIYRMADTVNRHPYLPLEMYWLGAARLISEFTKLPFPFVVKWLFIGADVCLILVIYLYMDHRSIPQPKRGALLYAINPIAVFVSAYHGQFDALPILFSIIGLFFINTSAWMVGFWIGLGIWIKSFPILALPTALELIRNHKGKIIVFGLSILLPFIGILLYVSVYNSRLDIVFNRAVTYNHGIGVWGYTYFLRLLSLYDHSFSVWVSLYFKVSRFVTLGILAVIWGIAVKKSDDPIYIYFITLLAFLAFTHAFSIQYLMWIIPLAIILGEDRWLLRYNLASVAYAFLVYNTLILNNSITNLMPWPKADLVIIIPSSLPVWIICLGWLFSFFLKTAGSESANS